MKKYILPTLLLLTAASCVPLESPSFETETEQKIDPASTARSCYILCDFSASQGQASRLAIISNAQTIMNRRQKDHSLRYYQIDGVNDASFFASDPPQINSIERPSDRDDRKKALKRLADSLAGLMKKLSQKPSLESTCIIKTLDKLLWSVKSRNAPADSIRILILSDMLEDCSYGFGRIDIDHHPFSQALQTLKRMPPPAASFASFKNIRLYLVISSQKNHDLNALQRFWQEVFKRYGLPADFDLSFELPNWVHR